MRRHARPRGRKLTDPAETRSSSRQPRRLARFLVGGVLAAMTTVLLVFDSTGLLLLVLRRRIVAVLAVSAFEGNDVSHDDLSHSITRLLLCRACDRD